MVDISNGSKQGILLAKQTVSGDSFDTEKNGWTFRSGPVGYALWRKEVKDRLFEYGLIKHEGNAPPSKEEAEKRFTETLRQDQSLSRRERGGRKLRQQSTGRER